MRLPVRIFLSFALGAPSSVAFALDCTPAAPVPDGSLRVAAPEMRAVPTRAASCITAAEVLALARRPALPSLPAVAPAPARQTATPTAGGYVPKTPHDNTPWRFDMQQNGKRMTAEEFDAWMKAKGIRVATGKPVGSATPTASAESASSGSAAAAPAPGGD